MDTLTPSCVIRRALLGLLIPALAFSSLPTGYAESGSQHGREEEQSDRQGGGDHDRLMDCSSLEHSGEGGGGKGRQHAGHRGEDESHKDNADRGRRYDTECPGGGSSSGVARGDFNGDGFADLAVGVPAEETPAGVAGSGAVNVIYGSANGLTTDASVPAPRFFSQNAEGIPGDGSEAGDGFGSALAAGNFNGDRYSDLAIGIPSEDNEVANSGRVVIIYGSPNGLTATDPDTLAAQSFEIADLDGTLLSGDEEFGKALAWGDFNGDTVGDLAIGAPGLEGFHVGPIDAPHPPPPTQPTGGAVFVLFGISGFGPSPAHSQMLHPGDFGDFNENLGKRFGEALAAGNFDGDGDNVSDLAIGIPHDDFSGVADSGTVEVKFGRLAGGFTGGLSTTLIPENMVSPAFPGAASQTRAQFGRALAAGDFDGDTIDDLAIGSPLRNAAGGLTDAGAVWVIQDILLNGGIPGPPIQFWEQSRVFPGATVNAEFNGAGSPTEAGDRFGAAMATGDFNRDGRSDLAIGSPLEGVRVRRDVVVGRPVFDIPRAGAVTVIYGATSGLSISARAPQLWHQELIRAGDAEENDQFGASLTAWNFGRNELVPGIRTPVATADLAIGVPLEDLPVNGRSIEDCGQINVIYGSFINGLTNTSAQRWHQGSHPNMGGREAGDRFGAALY
jgi:hypothetical protein